MTTLFTSGRFLGFDSSGNPLSGGKLYTYEAGTTTAKATFTTRGGGVANANPVILNSAGRASVWLGSGAYRVILKDADDVTLYDEDNIAGADSFSVTDYGAIGDGTTDDRAAIQAAIDAAADAGGGTVVIPHPTAYYRIALALQARSGVTVLVPNNATRIVCTGDGTAAEWPIFGCWLYGVTNGTNYNRCTAYVINAVSQGDKTVTLTTAGEAANFAVGDVVSVETQSVYQIAGTDYHTWLQLNVVKSIAGGVITLRHPLDESHALANIRQLTTNLYHQTAGSVDSAYELKAVRDFTLIGGTWEALDQAPYGAAGGLIDSIIKPYKVAAATGPAYGNCYANCTFEADVLLCTRVPVEVAFGSANTTVRVGSVSMRSVVGQDVVWYVAASESARKNDIFVGSIDCGDTAPVSNACIQINNGYGNTITIGSITGGDITPRDVVSIVTVAHTGTINTAYGNNIHVGYSNFSQQQRYVYIDTASLKNTIAGSFYGVETDSASADTRYGRIYGNRRQYDTEGSKALRALSYMNISTQYNSGSPLSKTTTFPAGLLQPGDIVKMRIRGYTSGNSGTKDLVVTLAGTDILELTGGAAIPASASLVPIDIDIEFVVSFTTAFAGQVTALVGTTLTASDIGISSLNMVTTAYDLEVSGTVAAGGDVMLLRTHRVTCLRPSVNSEHVLL